MKRSLGPRGDEPSAFNESRSAVVIEGEDADDVHAVNLYLNAPCEEGRRSQMSGPTISRTNRWPCAIRLSPCRFRCRQGTATLT